MCFRTDRVRIHLRLRCCFRGSMRRDWSLTRRRLRSASNEPPSDLTRCSISFGMIVAAGYAPCCATSARNRIPIAALAIVAENKRTDPMHRLKGVPGPLNHWGPEKRSSARYAGSPMDPWIRRYHEVDAWVLHGPERLERFPFTAGQVACATFIHGPCIRDQYGDGSILRYGGPCFARLRRQTDP